MVNKNILYYFILILILVSCKDNDILTPNDNNLYPTILTKLNQAKLDSLNNLLLLSLDSTIFAKIDSFGMTTHHNFGGNFYDESGNLITGSDIENENKAITHAKSAILKLNSFMNVVDTSKLIVKKVERDSNNDWEIEFKNQIYEYLEVLNTEIFAKITAKEFVTINGLNPHHYKNIIIPDNEIITKNKAKEILVGREIEVICHQQNKYIIAEESIRLETIEKCIYPYKEENSITLHIVWKIPVYYDSQTLKGWNFYIDVISGNIIYYEQLFYCD